MPVVYREGEGSGWGAAMVIAVVAVLALLVGYFAWWGPRNTSADTPAPSQPDVNIVQPSQPAPPAQPDVDINVTPPGPSGGTTSPEPSGGMTPPGPGGS